MNPEAAGFLFPASKAEKKWQWLHNLKRFKKYFLKPKSNSRVASSTSQEHRWTYTESWKTLCSPPPSLCVYVASVKTTIRTGRIVSNKKASHRKTKHTTWYTPGLHRASRQFQDPIKVQKDPSSSQAIPICSGQAQGSKHPPVHLIPHPHE